MLRLVSDEDFNNDIVRGLLRRDATVNVVRVQDVGLRSALDPDILSWAAVHDRVILTHDRNALVGFAWARVRNGVPMAGVLVADDRASIGNVIEDVLMFAQACNPAEFHDRVEYVPLK